MLVSTIIDATKINYSCLTELFLHVSTDKIQVITVPKELIRFRCISFTFRWGSINTPKEVAPLVMEAMTTLQVAASRKLQWQCQLFWYIE